MANIVYCSVANYCGDRLDHLPIEVDSPASLAFVCGLCLRVKDLWFNVGVSGLGFLVLGFCSGSLGFRVLSTVFRDSG